MSGAGTHAHALRIPVIMPSEVYCASCVDRLRAAVSALPGVESAEVDRRTGTITVVHDPEVLPEAAIEGRARQLGLDIGRGLGHAAWRVTGLD